MSSDDTKPKFDFTDPSYCTKCDKFDPENDVMIGGDDREVDTEESITATDEQEKDKEAKDGKETQAPADEKAPLTHEQKLSVVKNTFKDWLEYCYVQNEPIESLALELDGSSYTPHYAGSEEGKRRWTESRCELDYSTVNEIIATDECVYSPAEEDPDK